MAKHKADEQGHPARPSNTTSGGKQPADADEEASVEGGAPEGIAVYPPPASDRSGERTGNVPPAKQLPPDAPATENPDVPPAAPTAGEAIAAADAEMARLRAENAELKNKYEPQAKRATGPTARRRVAVPGREPEVVEYADPGPDGNHDAAAVAAYQQKHGLWALPTQPTVTAAD
jgi:hypothetical protein